MVQSLKVWHKKFFATSPATAETNNQDRYLIMVTVEKNQCLMGVLYTYGHFQAHVAQAEASTESQS